MYIEAFICPLAALPSYSDGELFFTDKTACLVIRRTYLLTRHISGKRSKNASQGIVSGIRFHLDK